MVELKDFKLLNDFGVRALLATIVLLGYIGSATLALYMENQEMLESLTSIYSPLVTTVIAFYFIGSVLKDSLINMKGQ